MDGAGVGGTRLAAVFEGNERAPALAFRGGACMVRVGVGGACLAAVLEEKEKTPALALGAVRGWCRSKRHLPGGSAYREIEGTSTGLEWQCVNGAEVGGTCLAVVLEEKEKTPALA